MLYIHVSSSLTLPSCVMIMAGKISYFLLNFALSSCDLRKLESVKQNITHNTVSFAENFQ